MTRMWSPSDLEWRAYAFRMSDLESAVDAWDGEDPRALLGVLREMVDLCSATEAPLANYIGLDDLPPLTLLAACIGAVVPGMVSGNKIEQQPV